MLFHTWHFMQSQSVWWEVCYFNLTGTSGCVQTFLDIALLEVLCLHTDLKSIALWDVISY